MRSTIDVDGADPQAGEVSHLGRNMRGCTATLAVTLFGAGLIMPSQECLLAGVICAGAAVFAKLLFG